METDCIHFKDTGYFSKIIQDYLDQKETLKPFYQYPAKLDSFEEVIRNREFSDQSRQVLSDALLNQYETDKVKLKKHLLVKENIDALKNSNAYTITTGHQLCLFTGPLYFIYKIVSTIKLTRQLQEQYPNKHFVPIYWMATEDHDFEEINHFNFLGEKIEWQTNQVGAVGRMKLDEMNDVFNSFNSLLTPYSTYSEELKVLFRNAYLKHDNLAAATRYLVNELFGDYGVVIVDGDDSSLKRLFVPTIKKELLENFSSVEVEKQSEELKQQYKIQVNPREINLFYLSEEGRHRIVSENGAYFINESTKSFSQNELLNELEETPDKFSPNVLLRPVYQETILPNLAYIGGGGELAYWFQLKTTFKAVDLAMPMLILRNSVAWMNEKQSKVFQQLGISIKQLFKTEGVLTKEWIIQKSNEDLALLSEKKDTEELFDLLIGKAAKIDKSLIDHVKALQTKQLSAFTKLSEKFIRAERRSKIESTQKIEFLKNTLFKNGGLQERSSNFSEIYRHFGKEMIEILLDRFQVPTDQFIIIH